MNPIKRGPCVEKGCECMEWMASSAAPDAKCTKCNHGGEVHEQLVKLESGRWKPLSEVLEVYSGATSAEARGSLKPAVTDLTEAASAVGTEGGDYKRQRTQATIQRTEGVYPVPPRSNGTKFFAFTQAYNDMLGRDATAAPLRIFMRAENLQIAKRLDQFVASEKGLFYLQGPPGVGKTKESIIWMLQTIVKGFKAKGSKAKGPKAEGSEGPWAWIPLRKSGDTGGLNEVYLLEKSTTLPNTVQYKSLITSDLVPALREWGVKVVVFDNCNQRNRGPVDACLLMRFKTIAVSSLQMTSDQSFANHEGYVANGWTEAEYLEACKDEEFYTSVKSALQTEDFTWRDLKDPALRAEVVAAKYHLAGGSARWMFQFSAEQLLAADCGTDSIATQLGRIASIDQVTLGFRSDRSVTEVNHMLSRIGGDVVIVSQYVAHQLVLRFGQALLQQALLLLKRSNPAVDGVLMEIDFVLRLGKSTPKKKSSINLVAKSGSNLVLQSGGKTVWYSLSTFADVELTVADGDWFIPQIFNNGGFDAVQYRVGKLIFVQVTRSVTHSFKLEWFQKFRVAFVAKFPELDIAACEVWFVVETKHVAEFKPAEPSGNLTGYAKGTYKVGGMRRIEATA